MERWGSWISKTVVLLVFTSIVSSGCEFARLPGIQAIPTPIPDLELKISAQIQSTLNDYNAATENNDKTLFMTTIDQKNWVVRDSFSASFDDVQRSGFPKTVKLGMTLINIEQKDEDLVLAHIERDRDGWRADWFFRKAGETWVISEPTEEEAGAPYVTTSGNYTFITYPIADDVNGKIIALMSNAEEHVRRDLGEAPTGRIDITVYPLISISPLRSGGLSTWQINPLADGTDRIDMTTPASWQFGFYDPQTGWESDIKLLMSHELARIAYVRNFGNPGQGADWFFEGLAEYVAGFDEMPDVIAAVQNNAIIPIVDASSSNIKIDLAHFENLDNTFLAYGLSESLVTFIVEKHGGMESFWKLAKAYDQTQDMDKALQDTLGISYEQFDASWREWLKEDYIKR